MATGVSSAIIGLIGVAVGGAIQFFALRRAELKRFQREARQVAYRKYLEGVSQLSFAPDDNDSHLKALAIIAEARGQIALCGSDEVIMYLNRAFKHGSDLRSLEAVDDLKRLLSAMRSDTLGNVLPGMETELYLMFYGAGPGAREL